MTKRLLTAIIIIAVALPLILIGNVPFLIFGSVVALIAIFEMIQLLPHTQKVPIEVKVFTVLATFYLMFSGFSFEKLTFASSGFEVDLMTLSLFVFFLLLIAVIRRAFTILDVGFFLMAIFYLGSTFHAMLYLRFMGLPYFLLIVVVVALSDSAAYLVGKRYGKRKLIPHISPNKTVEGAVGGTLCGVFVGVIFGLLTGVSTSVIFLVVMSLVISIVGQFGDLVASLMKRQFNIKDFGNLFPGHGGVLDRLDSHLFASLGLFILLNLMNVVN